MGIPLGYMYMHSTSRHIMRYTREGTCPKFNETSFSELISTVRNECRISVQLQIQSIGTFASIASVIIVKEPWSQPID